MNSLVHLLWSLIIPLLASLLLPVGVREVTFSVIFGFAIDLDHFYYIVRYHGLRSLRDSPTVSSLLKEVGRTTARYHTAAHELLGSVFVGLLSLFMMSELSPLIGSISLLSYLAHVIMDAISVRMMPLSPFSQKEVYFGLISPGTRKEKNLMLASLGVLTLLFVLKWTMSG